MQRRSMSNGENKANFRNGAGVHPKNRQVAPRRGGWRL